MIDRFDALLVAGTLLGAAGCAMIWLPLALLFASGVLLVLAVVTDRRTIAPRRRPPRKRVT